jgi:glycosyltransferase involved in cell wall biosynthesis
MERNGETGELEAEIKTTVVIPVWGEYVRWLPDAVRSLRAQDVSLRLVVVDNASQTTIESIDGSDVIHLPNRLPLGTARNVGLAQVRTPYVVFWDADDIALPGAFASLQQALTQDGSLVAFGLAIREAESGSRHRWPRRRLARLVRFPRVLAVLHSIWSQFPTTGATIIRTDAARAGGGFSDFDSGDDWCLGVSLAFRGRIGWSEQSGRIYHLHAGSVWSSFFSLRHQRRHAEIVRHRLRDDLGIPKWAKRLIPIIWFGQQSALAAHAVVNMLRRRRSGSDRTPGRPASTKHTNPNRRDEGQP